MVTDSGSGMLISSKFGLRYARSALVKAVFFFEGDSERKDDVGARNVCAPSEIVLVALRCASGSASSSAPY